MLTQDRGYCARGAHCPHSHDAIATSAPFPPGFGYPPFVPNHLAAYQLHPVPPFGASPSATPPVGADPISFGFRPPLGLAGSHTRRRPRPQAVHVTSSPTRVISVEKIPRASLSPQHIDAYFRKFGHVLDVSLDYQQSRALITFSSPDEANRALSSPAAVFGNRFVRVYRMPEIPDLDPTRLSGLPTVSSAPTDIGTSTAFKDSCDRSTVDNSLRDAGLDRKVEALKRADALQNITDKQKAALSKLDQLNASDVSERQTIMETLRHLDREADALRRASANTRQHDSEAIARLKRLREEVSDKCQVHLASSPITLNGDFVQAASLGLDPDSAGRAHGSPRARGRVYHRGANRGRGDSRSFRLDNRGTRLKVHAVEERIDPEDARRYFEASPEPPRDVCAHARQSY